MPTLKRTEGSCPMYNVSLSSSINVSMFHIAWLDILDRPHISPFTTKYIKTAINYKCGSKQFNFQQLNDTVPGKHYVLEGKLPVTNERLVQDYQVQEKDKAVSTAFCH